MSAIVNCQNCKNNFNIETDDFSFYEKMQVPAPTYCSQCRLHRRYLWRNEHFLFRKKEERTGEFIFSAYPPESKVKIFEHKYWWSDEWDPKSYGLDYDFSKTFFEQFSNLLHTVPLCDRAMKDCLNSDYSNNATNVKNAYLSFNAKNSENICYGFHFSGSNDCVDIYQTKDSRLCYETFSVVDSERVFWSINCAQCYNVWFSDNCRNCTDCFACVNLRNKKYCIFNKEYTKEEYEKEIVRLYDGSRNNISEMISRVNEFQKEFPVQYMHGNRNKNVTGDYIYASNNVFNSFELHNVDNARYCQFVRHSKDVYDYTSWGISSELIYESISCGESCQNLKFCFECWPSSHNLEYCVDCHSSSYSFGCIGLKKAEYCIFNKQYSKEEYFTLRSKIIEQMNSMPYISQNGAEYRYGEFFPHELSPFGYEASSASDYFKVGDINTNPSTHTPDIYTGDLPETISEIDDSIIGKIIECADGQSCDHRCVGAFKVTEMELQFYQRFNIPIPSICSNCRFYNRMEKLNPMVSRQGSCMCSIESHGHTGVCSSEFVTNYKIEKEKVLFCEECYKQEVS